MGALNLPSAADIERLTRRLRSLSQRLEGIEDSLSRIDRGTGQRLSAIEDQLGAIAAKVQDLSAEPAAPKPAAPPRTRSRSSTARGKATAKPASSTGSRQASRAKPKS
jgi:DNA anti-recombination protein RmuC